MEKINNNNDVDINNKKNNRKDKNILKNKLEEYKVFYKEELIKKHKVFIIIMLVLFFSIIFSILSKSNGIDISKIKIENKGYIEVLFKEKAFLSFLIIFSGITPYFYLPVVGIFSVYSMAVNLCSIYLVKKNIFIMLLSILGAIIQIIGYSLLISTGIYYCKKSTNKFRYTNYVSFGLKDVKKSIYEIRKQNEKLKKLQEKEHKKALEREKLNEKINYINLFISFVISFGIIAIGTIFLK